MKLSLGPRTLVYPSPVFIVGSYDSKEKPNLMTVAWGGICCSIPPCVAVSIRKATHSHGNIMEQKAFTINIPSEKFVKEADFIGITSGKNENKFESLSLTPIKSNLVNAPYIKEFPFVLECRVLHTFELGSHTQFVGEILDSKIDEHLIGELKVPDPLKLKPFYFDSGSRSYYSTGKIIGKAFSIGRDLK